MTGARMTEPALQRVIATPRVVNPADSAVVRPILASAGPMNSNLSTVHPADPAAAGWTRSSSVRGWSLEPGSTRGATLALTAVPPNQMALHVELGRGEGDTIMLGRAVSLGARCTGMCIRYYAVTLDHAPLAVGLALRAPGDHPWWIAEPSPVVFRRDADHMFVLDDIDTRALETIDRMFLILVTTSRDGFLVIQDVSWESSPVV